MEKTPTGERGDLSDFATKAGISVGYAHQLLDQPGAPNYKRPPVDRAILIYKRTGVMLGILEGANKREANTLLRMAERTGSIPDDE